MKEIGQQLASARVVLAPMAGITDLPFRQFAHQYGVRLSFGEMQATNPDLRDSQKSRLRRIMPSDPALRAVQLVGNDPQQMADAARFQIENGANHIDINMGCPAKKVCRKAAGSALLGDETRIAEILQSVVLAAEDVPVSLKIRTGLSPDKRNGVAIAQLAEQLGVQALTVHGRTRACRFGGEAEYDTIRRIKASVSIPVIANGDIETASKAYRVLTITGADAVMIGRGALGRPWWPGAISQALEALEREPVHPCSSAVAARLDSTADQLTPSLAEQQEGCLHHLQGLAALYGETRGMRIARKHMRWAVNRFELLPSACQGVTKAINQVASLGEGIDVMAAFYAYQAQNSGEAMSGGDRFFASKKVQMAA